MNKLVFSIPLILFILTPNVFALQQTIILPSSSSCSFEGPYNATTGTFNCAFPTTGNQTIIQSGSSITSYSYIIFQNSTGIYAVNGTNGHIDFSGNDATFVIQSAYNKVNQGSVFIKAGTYYLSHHLVFQTPNVGIETENGVLLKDNVNFPDKEMIIITGNNIASRFDFYVIDATANGNIGISGIRALNVNQISLYFNIIYVRSASGLIFDSTNGGGNWNNNINFGIITGINTQGSKGIDIEANGTGTNGIMQGNIFRFNMITSSQYDIYISEKTSNIFTLNEFHGNSLDITGTSSNSNIFIANNVILTQELFDITEFMAGDAGISGVGQHAGKNNYAPVNGCIFDVSGLQYSTGWFMDGTGNRIITNPNSIVNPITLSTTEGLSNFNGGSLVNYDTIYVKVSLPAMSAGQKIQYWFYDSLLDSYDGVLAKVVIEGNNPYIASAGDISYGNPNEGYLYVYSLTNSPAQTITLELKIAP